MNSHDEKTMELAEEYALARVDTALFNRKALPNGALVRIVSPREKELLAHISTPKPDCRLCLFRSFEHGNSVCNNMRECKDHSQFQFAPAAQLCEVTK